ncbi:MAG: hypothetical protein ACXABD_16950 [Candidatus Thorarchaeota archaeon]|jgi:hypothetical protein
MDKLNKVKFDSKDDNPYNYKNYHKMYYQKHKSQLEYYYKNREKILAKKKEIRDKHSFEEKTYMKQYQKEYYKQQSRIKIYCEKCDTTIMRRSWYLHIRSQKHNMTPEHYKSLLLKEIKQKIKPFHNAIYKSTINFDEKTYNRYRYQKQKYKKKMKNIKKRDKILLERHTKPYLDKIIIY